MLIMHDFYEDINSPYNAYINNKKAAKRRESVIGKFIGFLLVIVVLAVAYAAVAYCVPQFPGHELVAGLIKVTLSESTTSFSGSESDAIKSLRLCRLLVN